MINLFISQIFRVPGRAHHLPNTVWEFNCLRSSANQSQVTSNLQQGEFSYTAARQTKHSFSAKNTLILCLSIIYLSHRVSLGSLFSIEFSVPHTCYSLLCKTDVLYISDQHCLLTDPAPPGSLGLPHISQLCHLHNYTVKHYWMTASQRFIFRFIFLLTVSAGT